MDFTIDDMIEFFESEREYCEKEKIEFIKNILTTVWLKISIRFSLGTTLVYQRLTNQYLDSLLS